MHGVGGIVGALLTALFASSAITGAPTLGIGKQLGIQALSVVATIVFSGGMTWLLMTIVDKAIGIRVTTDEERMGLDLALHGERIE